MKIQGKPKTIPSYELTIIGEDGNAVVETKEGYAGLAHKETYKLRFKNDSDERIVAATKIDGKEVGNWVIGAHQTVDIDRPVEIAKLFTFLAKGTKEAKQAQLGKVAEDDLGLVSVTFTPEKKKEFAIRTPRWNDDDLLRSSLSLQALGGARRGETAKSFGAGGTGLSGHSDQSFRTVSFDGDDVRNVTLNLRLVHDKARTTKPDFQPLGGGNTPASGSTPVPPPVGKRRRGGPG